MYLEVLFMVTHNFGGEYKEHQTACVRSETLTPTGAQVGVTDGGATGR